MFSAIARFLTRLRRDKAGNTLVIVAAAMIPMTAVIGSAVDLSRVYMAKSRLQSACDSAALAARREMHDDALTDAVKAVGNSFLNFNFPVGTYRTGSLETDITKPEPGVVHIEASADLPTAVMQIFGFETMPVEVSCDASLNFVNTDVVLVLDVTGSMADPSSDGTAKIEALRDAVMALYDELAPVQAQLESQGLRLRYGIVPYSSAVNVGRLVYGVNPAYITNSVTVPSRVANFNTTSVSYNPNTPTTAAGVWEINSSSQSTSNCQSWVNASDVSAGGPAPTAMTVTRYDGSSTSSNYVEATDWGWSGAPDTSGSTRSCRRWRIVTTTTYTTVQNPNTFTNWTYRQETYNTASFKTPGGTIQLANSAIGNVPFPGGSFNAQQLAASGAGVATSSVSWNGCIEERSTTTSIDGGSSLVIPSAAKDLDINLLPTDDATRWRPQLPDVIYTRTAGSTSTSSSSSNTSTTGWIKNYTYSQGYWACPTAARRLTEWDRADLQTYVDGLQTVGGTYHDIGMIWGARLISTSGIFGDGCDEYNNMPCNRHVIFMTDGAQTAYCNVLTAWGVEQNDMRVTGSGSCPSQLARHQQRLRMVCNATKNMNTSVWVIGFDTTLNSDLTGCASNSNQATVATNSASLIARFRQIGNEIGALRLTR